jgi:hypothetical protein
MLRRDGSRRALSGGFGGRRLSMTLLGTEGSMHPMFLEQRLGDEGLRFNDFGSFL